MTTLVEAYRPILLVVTFAVLGLAFYLAYRPRPVATERRSMMIRLNKVILWLATAVVLVSICFPQTMSGFFAAPDEFTPDMQRTVMIVEGMT